MSKTRGFVTIATGQERYFNLARNLLYSYRQFASVQYPFALICDRENEYTPEFDDVILMKNAHCNYLDKLSLYDYLPYDETIFIDADSLAYGDLDEWWDIFKDADDFSLFGYAWTDLNSGRGWFIPRGDIDLWDKISFIPDFNGGIYYLRRSKICEEVFKLANYFAEHFHEYQFNGFREAADEPVLALAMAVQHCWPLDIHEKGLIFAPSPQTVDLDITVPKAHYHKDGREYDVHLIHWSNYRTKLALYRFEAEKLLALREGRASGFKYDILYQHKLRYYILCVENLKAYTERCVNKVKKVLSVRR